MSTTIIGFPRLGEFRELKFTTEKYFRNEITADELLAAAKDLRAKHWNIVKEKGISEIPSNDFSHYDNFLDAAFLFNVVPESVQNLDLTDLERYFALARGYHGEKVRGFGPGAPKPPINPGPYPGVAKSLRNPSRCAASSGRAFRPVRHPVSTQQTG